MSTHPQTMENAPTVRPPGVRGGFQVSERLHDCAARLREHLRSPAVSHWLKENHSLIQSHISDLRHTLRPSFLRRLHQNEDGEPRIYRIVTGWLASAPGVIDTDVLLPFAEVLRETQPLDISELWAFAPMLKFAIVERICAQFGQRTIGGGAAIRTLWAIEAISWKAFRRDGLADRRHLAARSSRRVLADGSSNPRSISAGTEPSGQTGKADRRRCSESRARTGRAGSRGGQQRLAHVPRRLLSGGTGRERFSIAVWDASVRSPRTCRSSLNAIPAFFYAAAVAVLMGLLIWAFQWVAGPAAWWMLALLLIPASQAALEITNASFSRLLSPRFIPSMDFLDAIPGRLQNDGGGSHACCFPNPIARSCSKTLKFAIWPIGTATCCSLC